MATAVPPHLVDEMVGMTGIAASEAILRLRANNNDLNRATNEFFDEPNNSKYTWEEDAFSSDRDGVTNNAGISFQINGPIDPGPSGYMSGAPSRPPSRTSSKSPLGRVISLEAEYAAADPRSKLSNEEAAEYDLQRALAQSAEEAGLAPQQYGTTNGLEMVHFGPANRPSYEESRWAMVSASGNAAVHEVFPDPEASDRRRGQSQPAFLKPSLDEHRLASILTIYHEIPLAREIFLDRENLLADYGHNPEWWAGKPIEARSTVMSYDGSDSDRRELEIEEVTYELQRLMAFLDRTERSYGSVEPLANLDAISKHPDGPDVEMKFFDQWKYAHRGSHVVPALVSKAVQPGLFDGAPQSKQFAMLDLELPIMMEDSEDIETLYDLTDHSLWNSSGFEVSNSAYLTHVADIVAFRIGGYDNSKSIKIPLIWYPDRYLKLNLEKSLAMRREKAYIRENIQKITSLQTRIGWYTVPGGTPMKIVDLIAAAMQHDKDILPGESSMKGEDSVSSFDAEMSSEPRAADKMNISDELKKLLASIEKKIITLEEEKEKARSTLRELSKMFTEPSEDINISPTHKYSLRGVSTDRFVTYIRRQSEPDLIDMDLDAEEPKVLEDQWWKIEYATSDSHPAKVFPVTQNEVMTAAYKDCKNAIVVYASEAAMNEPVRQLPDELEAFVRTDNLSFSAEFPINHELSDMQSQSLSPRSPGKRKYDESSEASEDTATSQRMQMADVSQIRWAGPVRKDANAVMTHQAVMDANAGWPLPAYEDVINGTESDVIVGQDPHELVDASWDAEAKQKAAVLSKEMEAKSGMPSLISNYKDAVAVRGSFVQGNNMDVDDLTSPSAEKS